MAKRKRQPMQFSKSLASRQLQGQLFQYLCLACVGVGIVLLIILLFSVVMQGWSYISADFFNNFPSRFAKKAGIKSALYGSLWLIVLTSLISVPVGVASSIYLEEFAKKNKFTDFIRLNIANLAGVPSIVYGMLGLVIFVRGFGLQRSVISGALTMSLLILPTIIIASSEALKAVPNSIRYAALALGSTRWQMVRDHILPASVPGMMTGTILGLSRAVGETAPLIMIGALTYVAFVPKSIHDPFAVLPIQIFNWASRPQIEFHYLAAAGIIVLLVFLLTMNALAIWIRHKFEKRK